jgi:hypothetical protein
MRIIVTAAGGIGTAAEELLREQGAPDDDALDVLAYTLVRAALGPPTPRPARTLRARGSRG